MMFLPGQLTRATFSEAAAAATTRKKKRNLRQPCEPISQPRNCDEITIRRNAKHTVSISYFSIAQKWMFGSRSISIWLIAVRWGWGLHAQSGCFWFLKSLALNIITIRQWQSFFEHRYPDELGPEVCIKWNCKLQNITWLITLTRK